jgi:hypothetical protein
MAYNAWQPNWGDDTSQWVWLRNYCSCPHCGIVWEHFETARTKTEDWPWAKSHYGTVTQCAHCGQWSEVRDHWRKGLRRYKIAPPEAAQNPEPQPHPKRRQKPSKPPFWARTRKPRPVKERDHACEEER